LNPDPDTDPDPAFQVNPDPDTDPGFDNPGLDKSTAEFFYLFIKLKIAK
jgi:hypothetical protein